MEMALGWGVGVEHNFDIVEIGEDKLAAAFETYETRTCAQKFSKRFCA